MNIRPLGDRVLIEPTAGDTVLYGKYAGSEIEFEGVKYIMMRQSDVLAVID